MFRKLLKSGVAWGLQQTHFGGQSSRFVAAYHRTVDEFPRDPDSGIPSLYISVKMLERQLDWIGRRFRFVSLDELMSLPPDAAPAAAVTFDDGYVDFYRQAFPLLKRKGIPAAVFVVTDLVGTTEWQIHDRIYGLLARSWRPGLAHALVDPLLSTMPQATLLRVIEHWQSGAALTDPDRRSLNWDEIAELHRAGITIGSHTRTHAILPAESKETVWSELRGSRLAIEARIGAPVRHFAYPCGQFNGAALKAVEDAGYHFAYTICAHRNRAHSHLTIPRKVLWENSCLDAAGSFSPSIMGCHVDGSFDLFKGCEMNHGGALCWS